MKKPLKPLLVGNVVAILVSVLFVFFFPAPNQDVNNIQLAIALLLGSGVTGYLCGTKGWFWGAMLAVVLFVEMVLVVFGLLLGKGLVSALFADSPINGDTTGMVYFIAFLIFVLISYVVVGATGGGLGSLLKKVSSR